MLTEFRRRMDEHNENLTETESIRKCQTSYKNEKYTRVQQQTG